MIRIHSIPRFATNIYMATLSRLVGGMLLFQLCRIVFYWLNRTYFPQTAWGDLPQLMAGGVVFDLSAILYLNALYLLMQVLPAPFTTHPTYQKASYWVYMVCNSLGLMTNVGDMIYYRFTLRRTCFDFFDEFANEQSKGSMLTTIVLDYWYMILVFGTLVYLLHRLYRLTDVKPLALRGYKYYLVSTALFLGSITLFVGGVRGGFAHSTRPITISNATQYVTNLGEEAIVLNTPFSLMQTIKIETLTRHDFYDTSAQLEATYSPIHTAQERDFTKKNVVVIILESFSKEYIGAFNEHRGIANYRSYTPFVDSLAGQSTIYLRSMANGRKSIDAMSSIFTSIPSIGHPFILTPYSNNRVTSLFDLLDAEGYHSSFFHGAPNGSMGFMAFAKKLGIDRYYGRNEYDIWRPDNDDFDGVWGIWDEKFLEYYSHELDQMKQPFASAVFTLSSHHPYRVPAEYEGVFDAGTIPLHQAVGYADNALRQFFERASQTSWYANTLFVVVADHANQSTHSEYQNVMGSYEIPILFFDPSHPEQEVHEGLASQIDIMPTVLSMLGYDRLYFSFGFDLTQQSDSTYFTVTNFGSHYQLYHDKYLLVFDGTETTAIYDYTRSFSDNIMTTCPLRPRMERLIKAFLQQHNNRMIDNQLTVSDKRKPSK